MKIAICSDLHLEFGTLDITNDQDADVLILSGDILIAEDLIRHHQKDDNEKVESKRYTNACEYRNFFKKISKEFPHVVYVAGNHEFYGGDWYKTISFLEEYTKQYGIHFLERKSIKIQDHLFIGATLWTDANKNDPITMHAIKDMMNDYRCIRDDKKSYRKICPHDTATRHNQSVDYIKTLISGNKGKSIVVVTHHAPSTLSIAECYKDNFIMNGAFVSDLNDFILDRPEIKLWTHGHTHHKFDYQLGETRVVCNPRGYIGKEQEASNFKLEYVEI